MLFEDHRFCMSVYEGSYQSEEPANGSGTQRERTEHCFQIPCWIYRAKIKRYKYFHCIFDLTCSANYAIKVISCVTN